MRVNRYRKAMSGVTSAYPSISAIRRRDRIVRDIGFLARAFYPGLNALPSGVNLPSTPA